jgi:hypothetical protein
MDEESARQLARLQIAMWLPAKCQVCQTPYRDVDDFRARNPRVGPGFQKGADITEFFVDDACMPRQ